MIFVAYILCEAFDVGAGVGATSEVDSPPKKETLRPELWFKVSLAFAPDHVLVIFCHDLEEFSTGKSGRAQQVQLVASKLKKRGWVVPTFNALTHGA